MMSSDQLEELLLAKLRESWEVFGHATGSGPNSESLEENFSPVRRDANE